MDVFDRLEQSTFKDLFSIFFLLKTSCRKILLPSRKSLNGVRQVRVANKLLPVTANLSRNKHGYIIMKFYKTKAEESVLLVKVEPGEEIIDKLKELGSFLDSAFFTGIGALRSATLGYFNGKEYLRKEFIHPEYGYELLSLVGNMTQSEEGIIVHCHAQLSDKDYQVFGGHLFEGIVSVTAEIAVVPLSPAIRRERDSKTGLLLWP